MPMTKPRVTWWLPALLLASLASGCATQSPPVEILNNDLPPLNVQSAVPLAPEPSAQRSRVETLLKSLDSDLEALLNLLPAPTTNEPGQMR